MRRLFFQWAMASSLALITMQAAAVVDDAHAGGVSVPAQPVTASGLEPEDAAFFDALQQAVRTGDRMKLAGWIRYPMIVRTGVGQPLRLRNRRDFMAAYPSLFTPRVRQTVIGSRHERLQVRNHGVMVGRGELWFAAQCDHRPCSLSSYRITALNPLAR